MKRVARRSMVKQRRKLRQDRFMRYLKFHRLNKGYTQAQLAKKAGVAQGTYCDYENGRKKPRPKQHLALAEAIERPVEELTSMLYGTNPDDMTLHTREPAGAGAK